MTAVLLCKNCCHIFSTNKEYKTHTCDAFNSSIDWTKSDCILNIVKKEHESEDIKNKLKCEYFKSKVFAKIAEKFSGVDMKEFFKEKPDRIDIYPNTKFNLVIHPAQPQTTEEKEKKKKEHYMSLKHITDDIVPEETVDERQKTIKEKINTSSHENIMKEISTVLETINKTNYNESVKKLKQNRKKIVPNITHDTYIIMLRHHYNVFEQMVNSESQKKKDSYIEKAFSPLEHRLLLSQYNIKFNIEPSDIELYHCLIPEEATYLELVPFNKEKYFKQSLTYDLAFSHIQDIIKRTLFNKYGYHNVVYMNIKKTDEKYTFYYLDKIEGGKRFWKFDYKLENFADRFCDIAVDRIVFYFRQLYSSVFHYNTLRPDFLKKATNLEFEFEQLIQNLILISDRNNMYKMFQQLVYEEAQFKPSEIDKVNQYNDRLQSRKNFNDVSDEDLKKTRMDNIAQLFENPSEDEVKMFISSRINS
jgi:hypothetical protein